MILKTFLWVGSGMRVLKSLWWSFFSWVLVGKKTSKPLVDMLQPKFTESWTHENCMLYICCVLSAEPGEQICGLGWWRTNLWSRSTVMKVKSLSHVRHFATPWTVAYHAPPSMGFSRQEYRSGLPFHPPGDLPNPRIEPRSPALQADALPSRPLGKPWWEGFPNVVSLPEESR